MDRREGSGDATHYCVVCAARWIKWPNGRWSVTTDCGPCCDNVPMDEAPIVQIQPDGSINGSDHTRARAAYDRAQWQAQKGRYQGIICAICDAPFEKHFTDWRCPRQVKPSFKFPPSPLSPIKEGSR